LAARPLGHLPCGVHDRMLDLIPGDVVAEVRTGLVWKVIAYNKGQKIAICERPGGGTCVIRAIPAVDLRLTEWEAL
jgi:hypothetical protein